MKSVKRKITDSSIVANSLLVLLPLSTGSLDARQRDAAFFTIREVADLVAAGKTLEEVLEIKPTADLDRRWGQVPSRSAADVLPIVYAEQSIQ